MSGEFWITNSTTTRSDFLVFARKTMDEHPYVMWEWVFGNFRSGKQNNALHVFCRLVAMELNAKGITFETFFKKGFEVPWTESIVKDNIWKPLQKAITGTEETSGARTTDYPKVYDHLNLKLSEHGIYVPWPVKDQNKSQQATTKAPNRG